MLTSGGREWVRVWDVVGERSLLRLTSLDFVTDLAFSSDGRRLAAAAEGGFIGPFTVLFELEADAGVQVLRSLQAPVSKVALTRDGRRIAAVASDWRAAVWDEEGRLLRLVDLPQGFTYDNCAIAFNAVGTALAFATGTEAGVWEIETGRRIGRWSLPPGLVDSLAVTSDDRLWLFRVETVRGDVRPSRGLPTAQHPRVCRIRELQPPHTTRLVAEIASFNGGLVAATVLADGSCFVVDGHHEEGGRRVRSVAAFRSTTGEMLWRTNSARSAWGWLQADPTSTLLSAMLDPEDQASWLDLRTGAVQCRGRPPNLGAGGEVVASEHPGQRGIIFFDQGGARELVRLGVDYENSHAIVFCPTGRRVAWGTRAGEVLVADLVEVNRRLSALGLGW